MTLVITTCTNRKRKPVSDSLYVSTLPKGPVSDLVADWVSRLEAAPDLFSANDLYCGRSFQEAKLAANLLDARLMVVSAGLGLIAANARVPPYACTVLVNASDSISARVAGDYSAGDWWRALGTVSPWSRSLASVTAESDGLICAALSDAYIEMIADELCALPVSVLERLRLFTRAPVDRILPALRPYLMPYDDRLDGPDSLVRGTRGDFAGRALRHFAEYVVSEGDDRSADEHGAAIASALSRWRMAVKFDRQRLDDNAVLTLIREHWEAERGSTSRLLRRLRDDLGVACEQKRFANLTRHVRSEKA